MRTVPRTSGEARSGHSHACSVCWCTAQRTVALVGVLPLLRAQVNHQLPTYFAHNDDFGSCLTAAVTTCRQYMSE